jgi:hypothetical protein
MPATTHDFAPVNPDAHMGGPCECGLGQWAPVHQQPATLSIFRALDRIDADRNNGPARLARARAYLHQAAADIADVGARGGMLDAVTWASWTHAALTRAALILDGRPTPPRLTIGDGRSLNPAPPPVQEALAV